MSRLGISSACYYPITTEQSFLELCRNDIKCIELFFNSPSEISEKFISEISGYQKEFDIEIPSIHPFMSFAESFYLFSSYERRFYDIIDLYKRFFEIMNVLGSEIFIFHGIKNPGTISDEEYFERFHKMIEIGKEYNITVCQENVVNYKSESIDFLQKMKNQLGSDFSMVLDIKQAVRTGYDPFDFVYEFHNNIKHIHISDHNTLNSCIPPLEGNFDFKRFFELLKSNGYNGKFIIELYEYSYKEKSQIYNAYNKLLQLLN